MALVIVLSVFNGFNGLVKSMYNTFDADLKITPATGKVFVPNTPVFDQVRRLPGIASFSEVLEENVLLEYRGYQDLATIKGIDSAFLATTRMPEAIIDGEFAPWHGEMEQAIVGSSVAYKLGIGVRFVDPLFMYVPKREGTISLINPQASLVSRYLYPGGIFTIEQSLDNHVFVPLRFARELLDYTHEVSAVEIQCDASANTAALQVQIKELLGTGFAVKDRYEQNATLFRMMESEKAVIYAILLFMLIVISCNILGSLAMLILEKKDDVFTLRSLGATERLIGRIFLLEGWLISLVGVVAGVLLGLFVCWLQQTFGLLSMPGTFTIAAYPVAVRWSDIFIIMAAVIAIGYVVAWLPVRYLRQM